MAESKRDLLTTCGTVLVGIGVAVGGVYALCRGGLGMEGTGRQFLPYHLAGVIPGMILRRRGFFAGIIKKMFGYEAR